MYARIKQSGPRRYVQLVQSYRNERGQARQRVVATLGRVDQLQDGQLDALIAGLQRATGNSGNSGDPEFAQALAFGHVWALHQLWEQLGFDAALARALRSSRRQFDAAALVRLMVFNRLCDPQSKLGVLRWLNTVALPEAPVAVSHDQLLRAMDALMDHAPAVQEAVAGQLRPLFDTQLSVVFYDLTTIRIHGTGAVDGDVRAFGMNKQTGGIARQFVLGVIQTAGGLPIAHRVHEGNVGEVSTLVPMIEDTLRRYHIAKVVLVADRGLLSLDNIEAIEALRTPAGKPLQYVLAVPGRRYAEFAELVHAVQLQDGVGDTKWQGRRLVVAHDGQRAQEQHERRRQQIASIEAEGQRMADRLDAADAGRPLRGRRSNDRRAYLRFNELTKAAHLSRIVRADLHADRFSFTLDEAALQAAEQLDGKLLLVTNTDLKSDEVVQRYKVLADIERGFRVLKHDIDIAPVYHRLPERIRAHALICFLALVLHRVMRQRLKAAGSACSPAVALSTLSAIQRHRVRIGRQELAGINRPDPQQMQLFAALETAKPPMH